MVGVDCGRGGRGKTRIYDRQGRRLGGYVDITLDTDDLMEVAGICAKIIGKLRVENSRTGSVFKCYTSG